MDPRRFLDLAGEWASGSDEGEWRTSSSRAYYAVFHVARRVLHRVGFQVPASEQAHGYLWLRLSNSGNTVINRVGNLLRDLRTSRNHADYDLDHPFEERWSVSDYDTAGDCIDVLEDLERTPDVLAQVTNAIRTYERDVLRDVTYRSP